MMPAPFAGLATMRDAGRRVSSADRRRAGRKARDRQRIDGGFPEGRMPVRAKVGRACAA